MGFKQISSAVTTFVLTIVWVAVPVTSSRAASSTAPSGVNIRLAESDKSTMSDKTYWLTGTGCGSTTTCSFVKFVVAGSDLTLHYVVTGTDGSPVANTPVDLETSLTDGLIESPYSGDTHKVTNNQGEVTFFLHNMAEGDAAEPRPMGCSSMSYWCDWRIVEQAYGLNFTPTIGADSEYVDRVWTHTVKPASVSGTANIYLTSGDRAGMDDKTYWWTNESASYSRVKFVLQGKNLVLNYVVTDASGNPITSTPVTLAATSMRGGATFTGDLTKNTDTNGAVTFTLTNTNAGSAAEDHPRAPSAINYWDDATRDASLSGLQYEMDFVPTVGADVEHVDRVWAHIVKPQEPSSPLGVGIRSTGSNSLAVSWMAPADDGNGALTHYTYTLRNYGVPVPGKSGTTSGTQVDISGLLSSGRYSVSVAAVNSLGSSNESTSVGYVSASGQSSGPPGVVSGVKTFPGNGQVTVTWLAPTVNNNASLVGYTVTVKSGSTLVKNVSVFSGALVKNASNQNVLGAVVNGLTNGVAYTFTVSATNASGSTPSAPTPIVVPFTSPREPTNVHATGAATSMFVTWNPPSSDGGFPIIHYYIEYRSTSGRLKRLEVSGDATSAFVSDLDGGVTYSVTVQARTVKGYSLLSSSTVATAGILPDFLNIQLAQPVSGGLIDRSKVWRESPESHSFAKYVSEDEQLNVDYRVTDALGAPVAGVRVVLSISRIVGGAFFTGGISGVTDMAGVATFRLTEAGDAVEASRADYSIWSDPVSGEVAMDFVPMVLGVAEYISRDRIWAHVIPAALPSPTPVATTIPVGAVPAVPVASSVFAGDKFAWVSIATPTSVIDGQLTTYQYSIDGGTTWAECSMDGDVCIIDGLINGVRTSLKFRARNAAGFGRPSKALYVTPVTTSQAATLSSITPSAGALTVVFSAPSDTGGSKITNYQYSLDGGQTWVTPAKAITKSPLKITGLANATSYAVKLRPVTAVGIGAVSETVSASTPALVATAPVISSLTAGKTSITVNFTAPTNNGGASITNYAYTVDGKTWITLNPAMTSSPIVITGLTSYKTYSVKIRAINSAGQGALSNVKSIKTLK